MDRRVESNADEIFRLGSPRELIEADIRPTYVVTGNVPCRAPYEGHISCDHICWADVRLYKFSG